MPKMEIKGINPPGAIKGIFPLQDLYQALLWNVLPCLWENGNSQRKQILGAARGRLRVESIGHQFLPFPSHNSKAMPRDCRAALTLYIPNLALDLQLIPCGTDGSPEWGLGKVLSSREVPPTTAKPPRLRLFMELIPFCALSGWKSAHFWAFGHFSVYFLKV